MDDTKNKHPGGRPHKFDTAEEMQSAIDDYFDNECKTEFYEDKEGNVLTTKYGPMVKNLNAPSLAGLALYLGYASRQSIYDNEKIEKFSYILKTARTRVEQWIYQHSLDGSVPPAVGIFILKQFGYSDKHEIEHSGNEEKPIFHRIKNLSVEELEQLDRISQKLSNNE